MSSDWKLASLEDLIAPGNPITYGVVKPGERDASGVIFIRGGDIADGEIQTGQLRTISRAISQQYKRTLLKGGELVVSLVGNPGQVAIVPSSLAGANIARQVGLVRLGDQVEPDFVKYYLLSQKGQEALRAKSKGSVQQVINLRDLKNVKIPVPDLPEQKAIAKILSSLDDKIGLNRRMNATLEEMARALFKAWFVDFEPVHANMENRLSTSASTKIAKLFPSEFENGVPKGWRVSTIGEEVQVVGGSTPSTKEPAFWNGEHKWVTPKDFSSLQDKILIRSERTITAEGLATISSGELPIDTVLLSSRAPVGYLAITKIPVSINQGFIAMKCNKKLTPSFVLQWLEHSMDKIKNRASGTTFAEISKANFRPLPIVVPNDEALESYERFAAEIYGKITLNARESENLSALRDELLPRLISGKLRVNI